MVLGVIGTDGTAEPVQLPQQAIRPAADFLDFLLVQFGRRRLLGDLAARSHLDLDAGHGVMLAQLHERVAATRAVRFEARFGPRPPHCRLSLVCVLFGVADLMYLLVSQFSRFGPLDRIEFVFVSNSPDLEEAFVRDAELASFVFQARIVLVSLNQNCGFGHAANVGVGGAQASTVCVINPDVYPRDRAAVAHMLQLAEGGLGNVLAGGKLHYADGSVMHEGMAFAEDARLSALAQRPVWSVEHPRKGFPDTGGTAVRRVPAVTGALMLLDKALYERVRGFDPGYILGYYEDADVCLRLRDTGAEVVVDPRLDFWHYEGKGSSPHPALTGARLHNQWRFSQCWASRLGQANDV
jgi:GT2 family glycosyltransferase